MKKIITFMATLLITTSLWAFEGEIVSTGSMAYKNALVELQPLRQTDDQLIFKMLVNTHSESFEFFDLKENTTLFVNGLELHPIELPNLYDHHNEGELIFELSEAVNSTVRITITDMAGEDLREFVW
jgi:hypothetical protein